MDYDNWKSTEIEYIEPCSNCASTGICVDCDGAGCDSCAKTGQCTCTRDEVEIVMR